MNKWYKKIKSVLIYMSKYIFSVDWFSQHIPLWDYHLKLYKNAPGLNFIEIGAFQGKASIWLLENILTNDTSKLTCIDTFEGSIEHKINDEYSKLLPSLFDVFSHNILKFKDRVNIIRDKSQNILHMLPRKSYDFIYIDGDHKASSVIQDAVLSFYLLKIGGILIFDDYTWGINNENDAKYNLVAPRPAIDAFLLLYSEKIEILHIGMQVVIKKMND